MRRVWLFVGLALGLAPGAAGCDGPRGDRDVTLEVVRTGAGMVHGGGICCGDDCRETYARGAVVTLTASASPGSTFTRWSGCDYVVGSTCAVTMEAARVVDARFSVIEVTGGAAHRPWAAPRR